LDLREGGSGPPESAVVLRGRVGRSAGREDISLGYMALTASSNTGLTVHLWPG
jgi:hypothetical protein